ncbi:hypothetical protein [Allomuricauda sp. M10]|uniref:hypothetical protein n=1 Tax=Allomuricauda sp. M10 TaxID=2683292 RepID=UPI001D185D71|nr:hypothetical protein [Muricauda sp. M10]
MITERDKISRVFNIFHDGTICGYEEILNGLRIKIDCYYLSSRLNPEFDSFFIDIIDQSKFEFIPWSPKEYSRKRISDLKIIRRWEFNIFRCKIENAGYQIDVEIENAKTAMIGGSFNFECNGIRIYDQSKSELTFKELSNLSDNYWAQFNA